LNIAEKDAGALTNRLRSFALRLPIKFETEHQWRFFVEWNASDQLLIDGECLFVPTRMTVNLNAKQAKCLCDQIVATRTAVAQTKSTASAMAKLRNALAMRMSPASLQTEVTYTYGDKYPVRMTFEVVNTEYALDITDKDAANLARLAQSFASTPLVEFSSGEGWDFYACWVTPDQFEITGEDKSVNASIKFHMNTKEAWTLSDQIMFTRSQATVMTQNGVSNAVSTVGPQAYAAINGSSQEKVYVSYNKGATHPISFSISKDGGAKVLYDMRVTEDDAHKFANLLESFTNHPPTGSGTHPNDILGFVTDDYCQLYVQWWNCVVLRITFPTGSIDISDDTAHELYKQIRDILCGPASNMKSVKTEECLDCKGKGYIEMLNRNVKCDCVGG